MKIICPNCNTSNNARNKNCTSCTVELQLNLTSTFQLENGKVLSIVDMLDKVQQLETRLVYVEENYRPTEVEKVQEVEVEKIKEPIKEKLKSTFSVPSTLPTTIEGLKALLKEVNIEKQAAKECADVVLFADLDFDSKKIAKRIQRLEQQEKEAEKEVQSPQELENKNVAEKKKVSYPETIEGLKKALKELEIKKELTNINRDIPGLEALLVTEKEIKRRLKHFELAERYGKDDEKLEKGEVEKPVAPKVVEEQTIATNNKNLIFEIEQELASVWGAKQRAKITQDGIRFRFLVDKEKALKKELEMAERGEIQARLESTTAQKIVQKEETKIVQKERIEVTSSKAKIIPQKKPVAVKVIKPKKEGPTALEQFFAPLVSAVSFVENKYAEYKKEGKLSLFFLTVAGIVTLLFGFGFLAQYSAVTYFGDYLTQIKVGFGFVCSAAAIGIGIRLIKKDKKFEEFGQALMGLGLSLNYLFIYFISADPPLIGTTVGFILIFINTAVSVVLSLRYESKIIALLALLGGALAPSYLQSTGENTHIYFAYLWLLCVASAYTAKRLSWEVLNFISFLLVTLILGSKTYLNYTDVRSLPDAMYLLLFHAFGYLYAYLSLFDGLKPKKEQSSMSIITLIGAQGAMMMSLYFVYGNQQEAYASLSLAYLLNMIPFALITVVFYQQWNEQQKSILIGISSAFVAAAIPAYFGIQYRGLLWALQGIVLLGGGLIFKLPIVRRLAYTVLMGGLVNMAFNLDWYSMPSRSVGQLFTTGYINLWSIGIVLMVVSFLLKKYETALEDHEQRVPVALNEILSVWGLSVFYLTTYFFFGNYACNLALIPMFALLVWNSYRKLYLAEILGLAQILALAFAVLLSMNEVHSYHFVDQLVYGQLAMLEILFVLWFMKLFYEKVLPEAPAYKHDLAAKTRAVFFVVLPLALLDTFYHVLPKFFGNYAYNLALIPMFALLIWNKYRKSYFTEILGLLQVFVLVFVVLFSMDKVGSYHFSDQLLYGQLGMLEILFVLWFMKLFYEKVFPEAPAYKHEIAARAREVFYLILPFALLDATYNGLPAYILYGLWGATTLAFVLAEYTKSKLVLVQFLGFVVVSMLFSCLSLELGPLILGNVLLLGIGYYKKAWTEEAFKQLDYKVLYLVMPYFLAVSVGLIYYIISNDDAFSGMQLVALVLLTMVNLGATLAPIRKTLDIAYRLAWGISFIALTVLFAYVNGRELVSNQAIVGFVVLLGVLAWSYKMIYKADIPYNGNQKSTLWQMELVTIHILTILSYSTLLCWITGNPTSLGLTIALFIHGIALVFNGLLPNYTHLNKVYIPIFAVAMIKLFLVDMKDADTIMKIIVFIIVGISCLLAAYFLIKFNDKNKPAVEPTTDSEISNSTKENDSTDTNELE